MTESMEAVPQAVDQVAREWLLALQDCVRRVDFAAGRALFAEDVVAFGSRAGMLLHGLDALQAEQWSDVWPNIAEFTFTLDQLDCRIKGDMALLVVPWTSTGYHSDGITFHRPGRATVALARRNGVWAAIHTHFSLAPGTPATSQRGRGIARS